MHNGYAYCANPNGLHLFNVSVPESLQYLGMFGTTPGRLTIGNDFLFDITHYCSLLVYDISNPVQPLIISSLGLTHFTRSKPYLKDSLYIFLNLLLMEKP
uniref:Uncharacterized protein n=1 Tax=candidate division WOR-3 bacterium TaxID=2052148 RepID=A0A7V1EHW0_UNCW3